mmetsp:Transcript_20806/g.65670  ORF Transcript_20806/g.65670 Transcript_20806/m.65670 type:complete len:201 (-) Transcript_20806:94-696(-)
MAGSEDSEDEAREMDYTLFCLGIYAPMALICTIVVLVATGFTIKGKPLGGFQPWQALCILTSAVGLFVLRQRWKEVDVPRSCDRCCICPFVPWLIIGFVCVDMFVVAIEFGIFQTAVQMKVAKPEDGPYVKVNSALRVVAMAVNFYFAFYWVDCLKEQDEDVCCGGRMNWDGRRPPKSRGDEEIAIVGPAAGVAGEYGTA